MHHCFYFCAVLKIKRLGVFFYNIFLLLFRLGTHLASPFYAKAGKWVKGRRAIFKRLEQAIQPGSPIIWVHCASLGEFEQGLPVIERLRSDYPDHRILLTFFSPSGYEVRKNYDGVDWVFYLPMDSASNARRFLEIVQPVLVIFVKYEFWYYYLKKIKYRNIPLLLISASFRSNMSFFKWYGGVQRKILSRFDHLFVQEQRSKKLIDEIGLAFICSVSGDTRFDRVKKIAQQFSPVIPVEHFIGKDKVIVAGSTWPDDEEVLRHTLDKLDDPSIKLVVAPHEITSKHLNDLDKLFPGSVRYSSIKNDEQLAIASSKVKVLIIDNIGMLSRLYHYGWLTYVGGGMTKTGVHNVLEAAVYGKIVLLGPNYQRYTEAVGLVQSGGAISFTDEKHDGELLSQLIIALGNDAKEYAYRSNASKEFVESNVGATDTIMRYIQEKRLLIN